MRFFLVVVYFGYFSPFFLYFRYPGSKHKLFDLIDLYSQCRPEESVITLMSYRINDLYTTKPGWIQAVREMTIKYFVQDRRTRVRIKALQCLLQIYKSNKVHEDEIFRELILPTFGKDSLFDEEKEVSVRLEGIAIMTAICKDCTSRKCIELLDTMEKIMLKPTLQSSQEENPEDSDKTVVVKWTDHKFEDIHLCTIGLIEVFVHRICLYPAMIPIRAYHILVKHLEVTYNNLETFGHIGKTRKAIFQLFMQLRANDKFHLGVEKERGMPVHFR